MTRDIESAARRASGGGGDHGIVWTDVPAWAIPPAVRDRLRPGVSWRDGRVFAKNVDGLTVSVIAGGAPNAPPKADAEAAVRRALERAEADKKRADTRRLVREVLGMRKTLEDAGIDTSQYRKPNPTTDPTTEPEPGDEPAGDVPEEN